MITKQIQMTRTMIEDCILNSKLFRDAVIDTMIPSDTTIHNEVLRVMRETNGQSNKIAFIKAIRILSENRAGEFARTFPGIIDPRPYDIFPKPSCLSLACFGYIG